MSLQRVSLLFSRACAVTSSSSAAAAQPAASQSRSYAVRPTFKTVSLPKRRSAEHKLYAGLRNHRKSGNFYGSHSRVRVNDQYISQLLDSYAARRTHRPAMKIFEKLRSRGSSPSIYNYRKLLYTVGYKGKQTQQAESIYEDLQRNTKLDEDVRRDLYCQNTMMHVYAKNVGGAEGYEKAKRVFDAMPTRNSFSYFYLLKCFLNTAPKQQPEVQGEHIANYDQEIELPEESKQAVAGVVQQMVDADVALLSNRHIKSLLQRMGMHDAATLAKQE